MGDVRSLARGGRALLLLLLTLQCGNCGGGGSGTRTDTPSSQQNAAADTALSDSPGAVLRYAARVAGAFFPFSGPAAPASGRIEPLDTVGPFGFRYQLEGLCVSGGNWLAHGEGARDPITGSIRLIGVLELLACDGQAAVIGTDLLVYAVDDEVFFHAALSYSMTALLDDFDELCTLHWAPLQFDGPLSAFFGLEERDEVVTSGTATLDCLETDFVCVLEPDTFSDFGDGLSDCVDDHLF